jgi:hypothetical protein
MAFKNGANGSTFRMMTRGMLIPVLLSVALLTTLPAQHALGSSTSASPVEILKAMPGELAGFTRLGQLTDYEARPNGAGLGASINFLEPRTRATVTVYVYARGRTDLMEGVGSPEVEQELDSSRQALERGIIGGVRTYTVSGRSRVADLPGGSKLPALRCDAYVLNFENDFTADSYICVGVLRGRFLKLHFTAARQTGTEPGVQFSRFGNAILAAMQGH